MPFAQLVTGSPGAGKSTYCAGMQQFLGALTPPRPCAVVNLDPANDATSYTCELDIRDFVTIEDVMEREELGPNGGVLWALEELEVDFNAPSEAESWFRTGLKSLEAEHVIFDCPGQVELFTHHDSLRKIFLRLDKMGYRMTVLHLTDSLVLTQPSLYISSLILALRAMLQLDLPHLNVLTKIDRLKDYGGDLPFNLDFYTEVQDLTYLLPFLDQERRGDMKEQNDQAPSRFAALNHALVELIDDYGLVSFIPLAIEDRKSMLALVHQIDRAGGYAFGPVAGTDQGAFGVAMRDVGRQGFGEADAFGIDVRDVQERWLDRRDELDDAERAEWAAESKMGANEPKEEEKPVNDTETKDESKDIDSDEDLEAMAKGFKKDGITITRRANPT